MTKTRDPKPFFKTNWKYLVTICKNKFKPAFGVIWMVRFILQVTAFFCLGNWIKAAADKGHLWTRRIVVEAYAIGKLIFVWYCIQHSWTIDGRLTWFLVYLCSDTLHALLSGIFLRYLWSEALSYKRNFILAFVNYMEVVLCFAAIYNYYDRADPKNPVFIVAEGLKPDSLKNKPYQLTPNQVSYFSFVTAATIGYGDISPKKESIQKIVVTEILITLALVVIIFANIIGKLDAGMLEQEDHPDEEGAQADEPLVGP